MKKLSLSIILIICFILNSSSQPSLIKTQISKIFFGVDLPITRFDLREKLNSSINLYNYKENEYSNTDFDGIEVKFKSNPVLGFTQSSIDKIIRCNFKKGYDRSEVISMDLWYNIKDITYSRSQINEIINKFKSISYKIEKEIKYDDELRKNKIGEDYFIYSTLKNYNNNNHYLRLSFSYFKENHKDEQNVIYELPNGDYIFLTVVVLSNYIM